MHDSQKYRSHSDLSEGFAVRDPHEIQRRHSGGCPRVVHGLRAAQPGEGDALTSPQPGQRWATGGQPGAGVIGAGSCCCSDVAPLNRCAVEADAGESAATGRRTRRAAELRCSGRSDRASQGRRKARSDRGVTANLRRRYRAPTACTVRAWTAALRGIQPLRSRGRVRTAPATSGRPWPSPLTTVLRSCTLGVLPRECVHPLRACTKPCPAGAQRARWSCAPCTPAAPLTGRCPHPRIVLSVRALWIGYRARSRGYRRPRDITRDYAHTSCVYRRGMRHPWRMKSRARVIRRYVTARQHVRVLVKVPRSRRGVAPASCTRCARLRAIPGLPLADSVSRLRAG